MPASSVSSKATAVLAAARALFLKHGIRRVSIEEVCREAVVSKRTFYKYFDNREALAIRVLGALFDESRGCIEATLQARMPIEDKVREIIATKRRFATETAAELYREAMTDDSELGQFARRRQREWDERVRRFYVGAKASRQLRADLDVDFLMAMLVQLRGIIEAPALSEIDPDFSHRVESVMKLFFYGIVPRPRRVAAHVRKARRS